METLVNNKSILLLSGGLDSSVLLSQMVRDQHQIIALSIDYGQLHDKELECAKWQVESYHGLVQWLYRDIKDVFKGIRSPLLGEGEIPEKSYAEQLKEKPGTVSTYVPYRNGILLSIAAAIALDSGAANIFYAAHMDDAAGSAYPDCTPEFIKAQDTAIFEGTGHEVHLNAPFVTGRYNKGDIVRLGLRNGVDFDHTWSCYRGGDKPCGVCATCIDRANAFKQAGIHL